MKFLNKTDYAARLFQGIYKVDLKKMIWFLRIAAILMTGFWGLEVFLEIINASPINPGNIYYIVLGVLILALSFYLPQLLAIRQVKRLKRRGMEGIHTIRVYEDYLTLRYENTGEERTIPLSKITRIIKISDYYKLSIGGKSTFIDVHGFELGDACDFFLMCEEYAEINRNREQDDVEESKARIRTAGKVRKGLPYASGEAEGAESVPEEEFDEAAYDAKNPKSIFGKAMLNTGCEEEDEIDWNYVTPEQESKEE